MKRRVCTYTCKCRLSHANLARRHCNSLLSLQQLQYILEPHASMTSALAPRCMIISRPDRENKMERERRLLHHLAMAESLRTRVSASEYTFVQCCYKDALQDLNIESGSEIAYQCAWWVHARSWLMIPHASQAVTIKLSRAKVCSTASLPQSSILMVWSTFDGLVHQILQ